MRLFSEGHASTPDKYRKGPKREQRGERSYDHRQPIDTAVRYWALKESMKLCTFHWSLHTSQAAIRNSINTEMTSPFGKSTTAWMPAIA